VKTRRRSALQILSGLEFHSPRPLTRRELKLLLQAKAEILARVEELSGFRIAREKLSNAVRD
jgi:hypothetical protein